MTLQTVTLSSLQLPAANPRTAFDPATLDGLAASIRTDGLLQNLLVAPVRGKGRYRIISGERRYRASLEVGLTELPCIEMDVDDRDVAEISLIENLQRKDLTPFEEADGLRALSERFGYTHEEIAQKIGKSRSTITESLSLAAIPSDVRDICRRADISSKSMLLQIVRQPSEDEMKRMAEQIQVRGLTRDEARNVRRGEPKKEKGYIFRCKAKNQSWAIVIKFRKSQVQNKDIKDALMSALERIDTE